MKKHSGFSADDPLLEVWVLEAWETYPFHLVQRVTEHFDTHPAVSLKDCQIAKLEDPRIVELNKEHELAAHQLSIVCEGLRIPNGAHFPAAAKLCRELLAAQTWRRAFKMRPKQWPDCLSNRQFCTLTDAQRQLILDTDFAYHKWKEADKELKEANQVLAKYADANRVLAKYYADAKRYADRIRALAQEYEDAKQARAGNLTAGNGKVHRWTEPDSKKRIAKRLNMSVDTLNRQIKSGQIQVREVSPRRFQIPEDLLSSPHITA